jgi:quercetin 2,3-dioxygenase
MLDQTTGSRQVLRLVQGQPTSDGAGVKLTRLIGNAALDALDPFLLLDEFRSDDGADYVAGFPDHPHRGFETVTYMLAGRMRHADNHGHAGQLGPGSVQWMTAGRGIVHSEMPEQEHGLIWGFQLWVNLPAKDKLVPPRYQEFDPASVPEVALAGGVRVRVIAGEVAGTPGPVKGIATAPRYLDIALPAGTSIALELPRAHNAFVYPFEGEALIGVPSVAVPRGTLAVLGPGERVALAAGSTPARMLLVAGQPLNEPVARYGPFVMNTPDEIHQAIDDFRAGRF